MVDQTSLAFDLNVVDTHNMNNDDTTAGELNNMSLENKKLREMLTLVCDNTNFLQNHVNKLMQDHDHLLATSSTSVKRKFNECDHECNTNECDHRGGSSKRPSDGLTRVYRRTDPCDTSMVVKDGYQWKKYGQKVTRDNPSPRAYYKCSFAPSCQVKKKVQRSVDDASLLIAIYDGEHNHESAENEHQNHTRNTRCNSPMDVKKFDEVLVEKMANSLRRNPDFIKELADAIFSKVF